MDNSIHPIYHGAIDPAEYPHDRLIKERVALLRCVDNKPLSNVLGPASIPETGKYYIADSTFHGNFFDFKADRPVFWAHVIDKTGRNGKSYPNEDFEIVDDPCGVMECRQGLLWYYYNHNQWLRTRLANRDHSLDIVSEEYLRENKLALVQFLEDDADLPFTFEQQLFALSHDADFTPGSVYVIVEEAADGTKSAKGMRAGLFEILSDPLGLLDPSQAEPEEILAMQMSIHPEWFPHGSKRQREIKARNQ